MGFAVPETALNVTLQEDKYHSYVEALNAMLQAGMAPLPDTAARPSFGKAPLPDKAARPLFPAAGKAPLPDKATPHLPFLQAYHW